MNTSQEEAFQTVNDYFNGRRYKILFANSPSNVRAEFGSYMALSVSTGTAKGEAEAVITKANNGSYVNLHFNFMKEYIVGLIGAVIGGLLSYALGYWYFSSSVPSYASAYSINQAFGMFNSIMGSISFMVFVFIMLIEGYYVSRTKKKLIAEFNNFAKSLPSTNLPPPPPQ